LLTHIEAKETESVSLGNYSINSSLKRYLDPNNNLTPHQQFVLDIQENYEAATFNQVTAEGDHKKFKFTRIPKEISKKESSQEIFMADVLKQIDDHEIMHDFVKDFFVKEGERFQKDFPEVDVQGAIKNVSNINEETAKKFAQGILVHTFRVKNQTTLTGTKDLLDILHSKGIDINGSPDNDMNALHWAACKNSIDKVNLLLEGEYQINIDLQDITGRTALHLAAEKGLANIVETLTDKNPNIISIQDNNGQMALHLAASSGHKNILETLLEYDPENANDLTTLHWAAKEGYIDLIKELINKNPSSITTQDKDNFTALHWAANNGHIDIVIVKVLIDKNKDIIDIKNNYGQTALHLAASEGHTEILEAIIDKNRKAVDITNNDGQTPLHSAAQEGHINAIEALITHAPSLINIKDNYGFTALHWAAQEGYINTVEELINMVQTLLIFKIITVLLL
ncbi:MAG: ankyrin repeat domain-containing protein, partial [Rickettsia endosymbiont of Bryobia graminum]|nr:ankyrin repeat domain-containing protein [Rickettsia endosymbiont of Bryobia graminum]